MERNEMKTIAAFTMALATLVLATAADADVQDRRCYQRASWISVRAGTPCGFGTSMGGYSKEIIEPPHNGTAVVRADGSIYYSPKPGFTGRDNGMRVQRTACNYSGTWYAGPSHDWCGPLVRTYAIFVE
jgi:hypothetical protein